MFISPAAVLKESAVVPVPFAPGACGSNAKLENMVRTPALAKSRLRRPAPPNKSAGRGAKEDCEPGAESGAVNRRESGPAVSRATLS